MTTLVYLIPVALFLGALGLSGFLWALRSGQYEDLDGAAQRILIDPDDTSSAVKTMQIDAPSVQRSKDMTRPGGKGCMPKPS